MQQEIVKAARVTTLRSMAQIRATWYMLRISGETLHSLGEMYFSLVQ